MGSLIFPLIITIVAFSWLLAQTLIFKPALFWRNLMSTIILIQAVWLIWLVLSRSN